MDDDEAMSPAGADACAPVSGKRTRPGPRSYVRRAYAKKVAAVLALCRRLEAGESVAEACKCPLMPARSTLMYWLATDPALKRMVDEAEAAACAVFGPGRREYHRWDPEVAEEVLSRIRDGRGLWEVCAERDMPSGATVYRWLGERPGFRDDYLRAREAQADRLFDLAWRIACEADEDEVKTARLKIQTLKWRVQKLAPRLYGTLKAQEPARGPDDVEEREAGDMAGRKVEHQILFDVRRWAVTPDRRVVEVTDASRGMSEHDHTALQAAVRDGTVTEADLAAMAARVLAGQPRGWP